MPKNETAKVHVVDAADVERPQRVSPMTRLLNSVEGDYWISKQVAKHLGVHNETIRRVTKKYTDEGKKVVKAPSKALKAGGTVIYLYDMDDVVELEDYFIGSGYMLNKRINTEKTLEEQG